MGNCKSVGKGAVIKSTGKGRRKLTLAILGLDNAGKTVTANGLKGEIIEDVTPTIGFSNVEFAFGKFDIVLFDLGGGKRIRGIWKDYFAEVYGVVYVIDSTDEERIEECKQTLHEMIEHPKVQGKPLLILANKQDQPGALDEIDICEKLQLEQVVNYNRCPSRVETCSAINGKGKGKKIDPGITHGFQWLLDTIMNSFEKLDLRVTEDTEEQKRIQEIEKAERKERVRRLREERERKETAERVRQGLPPNPDDDDDVGINGKIDGDPFKSIKDTIKSNELKLGSSIDRKKLGRIGGSKHTTADDDDEETDIPPSSAFSRSHNRTRRFSDPDMLGNKKLFSSDDKFKYKDPDMTLSQSALKLSLRSNNSNNSARDRYSKTSYDSPRPERNNGNLSGRLNRFDNDSDEEGIKSSRSLGHINKDRSSSPPPYVGNRYGTNNPLGFDDDVLAPRKPAGHLAPLQPLEAYDKKKKKKKNRFGKHNQTFPENSDREDTYGEDADVRAVSGLDNPHKSTPRNWAVTSSQHSPSKASRSPRLDPVAEPDEDTSSYGTKWNLADELPELPKSKSRFRQRPNVDYDDILV